MRELQHEEQDMYTKQRNDNMRGNIIQNRGKIKRGELYTKYYTNTGPSLSSLLFFSLFFQFFYFLLIFLKKGNISC